MPSGTSRLIVKPKFRCGFLLITLMKQLTLVAVLNDDVHSRLVIRLTYFVCVAEKTQIRARTITTFIL